MTRPTAAPIRFPYHDHRTMAEVDAMLERCADVREYGYNRRWYAKRKAKLSLKSDKGKTVPQALQKNES